MCVKLSCGKKDRRWTEEKEGLLRLFRSLLLMPRIFQRQRCIQNAQPGKRHAHCQREERNRFGVYQRIGCQLHRLRGGRPLPLRQQLCRRHMSIGVIERQLISNAPREDRQRKQSNGDHHPIRFAPFCLLCVHSEIELVLLANKCPVALDFVNKILVSMVQIFGFRKIALLPIAKRTVINR